MSADGDRLKDVFDGDLTAFDEVRTWSRPRVRAAVGKHYVVDDRAVAYALSQLVGGAGEAVAHDWAELVRDHVLPVADGDPVRVDVDGPATGPAARGLERLAALGEDEAAPLTEDECRQLIDAIENT